MVFVYSGSDMKVRDDELGAELKETIEPDGGPWTSPYILKIAELACWFEVISGESKSYVALSKEGKERKRWAMDRIYVLENTLRFGLNFGLSKIGKPAATEQDYERIKEIVKQGLYVLHTRGGETLPHIPDGTFEVRFEKNIKAFDAKYPGKLYNFNPNAFPGLPTT